MKLGFICPNLPSHFNPMAALARQLQTRNRDVVFLYSAGAAGLPFISADEKGAIRTRNSRIPEFRVIC
jgi:UDP:flavonoid glycosyltransferase YjiC (YdhE family)